MNIEPIHLFDNNKDVANYIKTNDFLSSYNFYLNNRVFSSSSNVIGLKLISDNKIIGTTLLLIHDENNIKIGNISFTYIDSEYRGRNLSALIINEAKKYCDVLTDLTPVDSIIKQFNTNKITDFYNISNYQLWVNIHNIHKFKKNIFISQSKNSKTPILESLQYGMYGYDILIDNSLICICFYSFKRKGIKTIEITYVSNFEILKNNLHDILKALSRVFKFDIAFIDGVFINNKCFSKKIRCNKKTTARYIKNMLALLLRKQIVLESRKYYWKKNKDICWDVNYLSSELCFYK